MTKNYLLAELIFVFGVLPLLLAILKPHGAIYFILWITMLLCCRWMEKSERYDFITDWNGKGLTGYNMKKILARFAPLAMLLLVFTWEMIPERMFSLPREKPAMWIMVMLFYPLLSVVPQELIFRSFFFRRYGKIMSPAALHIASALAFGWVHIILRNWIAVSLSAIGGYMFARNYARNNSLALVCLEHALYGCYIFTIGLGFYFYHGTAVR